MVIFAKSVLPLLSRLSLDQAGVRAAIREYYIRKGFLIMQIGTANNNAFIHTPLTTIFFRVFMEQSYFPLCCAIWLIVSLCPGKHRLFSSISRCLPSYQVASGRAGQTTNITLDPRYLTLALRKERICLWGTHDSGPHPCLWRVCYRRGLPCLVVTS